MYSSTSKIDDVLTEHGGMLHVLPLAVCLKFILRTSWGDHCETFLLFGYYYGTPSSWLKVFGWWLVAFGTFRVLNWVGLGWGWA